MMVTFIYNISFTTSTNNSNKNTIGKHNKAAMITIITTEQEKEILPSFGCNRHPKLAGSA